MRTVPTFASCLAEVSVAAQLAVAIGAALFGAFAGYSFRRREHLREQRLGAYGELVATALAAARAGAALLSVHTQTGYPDELNPQTWTPDQRQAMAKAHAEAFASAARARHDFELAVQGSRLVAGRSMLASVDNVSAFLDSAMYDGLPWKRGGNYPSAGLNPADLTAATIAACQPIVARARDELWRGVVPRHKGQ